MLNLTNYDDHPSRPGYKVYRFYDKRRADYFESLLVEKGIWFESSVADEPREEFLFGIRVANHKDALQMNYLVSAKFRKKTVPYPYLRIIIYLVALGMITLAIVGALRT